MRLKSLCKQEFCANSLITIPSALSGRETQEAIQRFCVGISNRVIKKSKNLLAPIGHSSQQGLKGRVHLRRNTRLPLTVQCKSLLTALSSPDIKKGLLEIIGCAQFWQVLRPRFQKERSTRTLLYKGTVSGKRGDY